MFQSSLAYIVTAVFMFICSFIMVQGLETADMRPVFSIMQFLFIFVVPFFTMRSFSEEFKSGTDELLMTSPVSLTQIVVGKFLSVMGLITAILVLSLQYVYIIGAYGDPDWAPVITGYLGIFLLCGAFVSIGIFISSTTKNQIVAALGTLMLIIVLIAINAVSTLFSNPVIQQVLELAGMTKHYMDFLNGVIDTAHVVYFVLFIALFLFLTVRSLESKRV